MCKICTIYYKTVLNFLVFVKKVLYNEILYKSL
jgi:hypothetical protein